MKTRKNLRSSDIAVKFLIIVSAGAFALACSDNSSTNNPPDASTQSPNDGSSPVHDSGVDAGDASIAPKDAGSDTGQTANDAGSDAGADGSTDASTQPTGANWMGALPGSKSLTALTIPGSHDTGARFENSAGTVKCQDLTIADQLAAGIRYFDIRVRNVSNKFEIYHLTVDQNLTFDDVLAGIYDHFTHNPGETLIMSLKEEQSALTSSNTFEQTFDSYTSQHPDRWYLSATIPTLDQARGKIVLLRRFGALTTPKGIDATSGWQDNTTFTLDNGTAKLRIQDYYEISTDDSKWTSITGLFTESKASAGMDMLYLNNTSAYLVLDGGAEDIPGVSNIINPKVSTYFTTNTSGRYGIVAMDFVDAATSSLILHTNF